MLRTIASFFIVVVSATSAQAASFGFNLSVDSAVGYVSPSLIGWPSRAMISEETLLSAGVYLNTQWFVGVAGRYSLQQTLLHSASADDIDVAGRGWLVGPSFSYLPNTQAALQCALLAVGHEEERSPPLALDLRAEIFISPIWSVDGLLRYEWLRLEDSQKSASEKFIGVGLSYHFNAGHQ